MVDQSMLDGGTTVCTLRSALADELAAAGIDTAFGLTATTA
jgi:hypothetical protein